MAIVQNIGGGEYFSLGNGDGGYSGYGDDSGEADRGCSEQEQAIFLKIVNRPNRWVSLLTKIIVSQNPKGDQGVGIRHTDVLAAPTTRTRDSGTCLGSTPESIFVGLYRLVRSHYVHW